MKRARIAAVLLVPAILLLVAGCDDGTPMETGFSDVQLIIVPQEATLTAGETIQLSLMVRDAQGNLTPHPASLEARWQTSDAEIAKVTSDGTVTALGDGEVDVTAGCRGQCAWATVLVGDGS